MKVLLAVDERAAGGYVPPLVRELEELGVEVACSVASALEPAGEADVVHLHWPEALCGWQAPDGGCVERVRRTLDAWGARGVPVVVTRHNELPHLHRGPAARALYDAVYEAAAAVVHLGPVGRKELAGRYGALHVEIPHGCELTEPTERGRARGELGVPADAFVVLVFGTVRTFAEQRLILETARRLDDAGAHWIVPRWDDATRPSWKRAPLVRLRSLATDRAAGRLLELGGGRVPDAAVPAYFGAADVVFIPRIDALNSGVLSQAYGFGRPVVGPRVGNIGPVLEATGNFTYQPGDAHSAVEALSAARQADLEALGQGNRRHAEERWRWGEVARGHLELYERAVDSSP